MLFTKQTPVCSSLLVAVLMFLASVLKNDAQTTSWVNSDESGVSVEIAFNKIIKSDAGKRREMFLYIEPTNFSSENVRKIFLYYSQKFRKPENLTQTLYTDKEMLQRAFKSATASFFIDWAETPEGKKAGGEWSAKYEPLSTGYFRAEYFRIPRFNPIHTQEEYSYSPDPNDTHVVKVVLQKNPCPCPQR